jgi:hypothetical protein
MMGFHSWEGAMAEIVIRRPSAWGDKMRSYRIVVDGDHVGTVGENAEARIAVKPGRHTVRLKIDWCWSPPLEIDVDAGMQRTLECGPNAHPFLALVYITFLKNRYLWLRDSGTRALPIAA